MRKVSVLVRLAALGLSTCAVPTFAADGIGGSLGVVSDYVYRGISQSDSRPALQGDLHYANSHGFSAGLWGSTVQLNRMDGRTAELDAYLGYRWVLTVDWSARLTAIHYAYPWNSSVDYDYDELIGALAFRNNFFLTAAWSFDASRYALNTFYKHHDAFSYEAAASLPLWRALAGNIGVGRYNYESVRGAGYTYWNAGLGYDWRDWHVDVNYIGASDSAAQLAGRDNTGNRFAATLLWRF